MNEKSFIIYNVSNTYGLFWERGYTPPTCQEKPQHLSVCRAHLVFMIFMEKIQPLVKVTYPCKRVPIPYLAKCQVTALY